MGGLRQECCMLCIELILHHVGYLMFYLWFMYLLQSELEQSLSVAEFLLERS